MDLDQALDLYKKVQRLALENLWQYVPAMLRVNYIGCHIPTTGGCDTNPMRGDGLHPARGFLAQALVLPSHRGERVAAEVTWSLRRKSMRKYVVRRFLNMIPTLLLVSLGVFALVRWLPSDPARLLAGVDESGAIDPALYVKIKHDLGLDQPLLVQYGSWLAGVVRGQLGEVLLERHGGLSTDHASAAFHCAVSAGRLGLRSPAWDSPRHGVGSAAQLAHSIWP